MVVCLVGCGGDTPLVRPGPPSPRLATDVVPRELDATASVDATTRVDATVIADAISIVTCMSDERRWGTTCCRTSQHGRRTSMSCRGPQLGKSCTRRTDCDLACACDRSLIHHDGQTGVVGTCSGYQPSGEWLCRLDDQGGVTSLIID